MEVLLIMSQRIAIVGGGRIGEALLAGLLESGTQVKDLVVVEHSTARAAEISDTYGVLTTDLTTAVEGASVVVVAVKPKDVDGVIEALGRLDDDDDLEHVIVSLAAGVTISHYENKLPAGFPIIRVMPNTAMLVGESMSGVSAGRFASQENIDLVVAMMSSVGKVLVVPESQMDAVTAISGSGPAYAFFLAEAMVDAGVGLGLTRAQATQLAAQTIKGAGILLTDSGSSPTDLRAAVTSPGGTTAAALREFERHAVRSAVNEAAFACAARSAEGAGGASASSEGAAVSPDRS